MKTEEKELLAIGWILTVLGMIFMLAITLDKYMTLSDELDELRAETSRILDESEARWDKELQEVKAELEAELEETRGEIESVKGVGRNTNAALTRISRRLNDLLEGSRTSKEDEGGRESTSEPSDGNLAALATSNEQIEAPAETGSAEGMEYFGCWEISAYEWSDQPCANGNWPTVWYSAACNYLPFGTQIYIDGLGYFVVEDKIGIDSRIDIFLGDYDACIQFGTTCRDVYIVN